MQFIKYEKMLKTAFLVLSIFSQFCRIYYLKNFVRGSDPLTKSLRNYEGAVRGSDPINSGLNMTTAINMFLRTAIREHGIPFELKLEVPNDTTAAAIEEGRKMMKDPSAPRYSSMDALKAALDV